MDKSELGDSEGRGWTCLELNVIDEGCEVFVASYDPPKPTTC